MGFKIYKNDCLAIQNCHAETGFDDLKKSTQKARNKIYAKLGSKDPYVATKKICDTRFGKVP